MKLFSKPRIKVRIKIENKLKRIGKMKYQVAEKGYEPSEMHPDGLKFVLDPFETKEEAEAAIRAMLEQAKEDRYKDSANNYVIVELERGAILPPPFTNLNK